MSDIAAVGAALALYGISPLTAEQPTPDGQPAGRAADTAADVGPAAVLTLSSLGLQSQMVSTLFGAQLPPPTVGGTVDVRA